MHPLSWWPIGCWQSKHTYIRLHAIGPYWQGCVVVVGLPVGSVHDSALYCLDIHDLRLTMILSLPQSMGLLCSVFVSPCTSVLLIESAIVSQKSRCVLTYVSLFQVPPPGFIFALRLNWLTSRCSLHILSVTSCSHHAIRLSLLLNNL